MNECKYSLRHHLQSLEMYSRLINNSPYIDYYSYIRINKEVNRRISCIREYLSIPSKDVSKKSYGEMFDDTKGWLKYE